MYEQFPNKIELKLYNIVKVADETKYPEGIYKPGSPVNELITSKEDIEFATNTLSWLQETGFIVGKLKTRYEYTNTTLTLKGLELLKLTPSSIKGGKSIGESLLSLTKDGINQGAKKTVSDLINKAFMNSNIIVQLAGYLKDIS